MPLVIPTEWPKLRQLVSIWARRTLASASYRMASSRSSPTTRATAAHPPVWPSQNPGVSSETLPGNRWPWTPPTRCSMPSVSSDDNFMTLQCNLTWNAGPSVSSAMVENPRSVWVTRERTRPSPQKRSPPWCSGRWGRRPRLTSARWVADYFTDNFHLFVDKSIANYLHQCLSILIKMTCYQSRKFHCGDKTILWRFYLNNGISYNGKTTYLHWIRAQSIKKISNSMSHW